MQHSMDEKWFNNLGSFFIFHWREKLEILYNEGLFNSSFVFLYVVKAFISLDWKS